MEENEKWYCKCKFSAYGLIFGVCPATVSYSYQIRIEKGKNLMGKIEVQKQFTGKSGVNHDKESIVS